MTSFFGHEEDGQALVIVGAAMFVLISAVALSIDWGYSFAARRVAQNEADSAALAAGRRLVSTYVGASFEASQEEIWCEAKTRRDAYVPSPDRAIARTLSVSFSSDAVSWTTITNVSDCAAVAVPTSVPSTTTLLRVVSGATYRSLIGGVMRDPLQIAASARVQLAAGAGVRPLPIPEINAGTAGDGLSGGTVGPNVAIWPIVWRFELDALNPLGLPGLPCGQYCTASREVRLWPSSRASLVTFAHHSPREAGAGDTVHQPITESDYTGSPTAHSHQGYGPSPAMPNADPRACGGNPWDSSGSADLLSAASCDLPHWFSYGYRGSLSIGTNWADSSWSGFRNSPGQLELPDQLPSSRSACGAPAYFAAPSCVGSNRLGDWVETVNSGVDNDLIRDRMRAFVQTYGREAPNGRGLAAVVHIFLWDCAESFDGSQPPLSRWTRIPSDPSIDCSTATGATPDRVHLFSVAPFTIYLSDIRATGPARVDGYWGDVFGDAGTCGAIPLPAGCGLNPLINSAYLISDE